MADPKSQKSAKPKATKKPKGPKFSARLVRAEEVLKIRTRFKHHTGSYEVEVLHYPEGDVAPGGKGTRAPNDLVTGTAYATFAEAQNAALAEVEFAKTKKGFVPQEKTGKRTAIGWDAV